ncbi:MAG: carboxypeptidase regulatory-like domain-containing protein [Bacteroidia bacterium]|nr:carboxypeptidase regulatory-like domain-containing protein [Bacteroidia bacterium]
MAILGIGFKNPILAQTGALIGKIKNAYSENEIPNATITLIGNQQVFQTTSNHIGIYQFNELPKGVYSVTIYKDNFKTNELLNFITITEDSVVTIGFKLIPNFEVQKQNLNALITKSCIRCCDITLPKNYVNYTITNWVKHPDIEEFYWYSYKKINAPISFSNNSLTNPNPYYITQLRIASDYFAVKQ